ncbi:dihydrofolate reductase family protein [Prescottella sp. R16]|uniref:dihydrofolate reductase family protein n=1 Tax=Prescottella sp. R16 TaxID=3064529 RepID=UPI00272E61B9|nr:dihydrofolate reductase family protein [Prescottella sp. R16]
MRELVYYVAAGLDGCIAGPDGQFDAFSTEGDHMADLARFADALPTDGAEHLGIAQPCTGFDTVLMGWNTYAVGLPGTVSPYRHLRQIVFSRNHTADAENLEVTAADPVESVRELKRQPGADIWLCGGGTLASLLSGEIDRIVVKRHPVLFGAGIPMFAPGTYLPTVFDVADTRTFGSGVSVTEYVRRR